MALGKHSKRVVIGIGLALVVFGLAFLLVSWQSRRGLFGRLETLRNAGQPTSLAELETWLRQRPLPESAAAGSDIDESAPSRNATGRLGSIREDLEAIGRQGADVFAKPWPVRQEDLKRFEAAFAERPTLIARLRQAAESPCWVPEIAFAPPASVFIDESSTWYSQHRLAARVLSAAAQLQLARGDPEAALETCSLALRLARVGQGVGLVGHLVSLSCQTTALHNANLILRRAPVSAAARRAFDARLARLEGADAYRFALITERAIGCELFAELTNQWIGGPLQMRGEWRSYLDLLERELEQSEASYAEWSARIPPASELSRRTAPLTSLFATSIAPGRKAVARGQALVRCLRVLLAGLEYAERTGRWPDHLDELNLPGAVPTDPFTDQPLHYRLTSEGPIIYSVGDNGSDDSGTFDEQKDIGFGPIQP